MVKFRFECSVLDEKVLSEIQGDLQFLKRYPIKRLNGYEPPSEESETERRIEVGEFGEGILSYYVTCWTVRNANGDKTYKIAEQRFSIEDVRELRAYEEAKRKFVRVFR